MTAKKKSKSVVHELGRGRLSWKDIDAMLSAGKIEGVPAGTDLEEFLWQTRPESRPEIEARSPGRAFKPAAWAKKTVEDT